ncbi:replication initiator protein A [Cereibacter azotoformans]|uniref:replication initiator protein A n=1 Tax=Cereibacter azotoformans TaxID=43057 RepID=UPI003B8A5B89
MQETGGRRTAATAAMGARASRAAGQATADPGPEVTGPGEATARMARTRKAAKTAAAEGPAGGTVAAGRRATPAARAPETADFFICDILDALPKDDMASMEHPVFSLATRPDLRVLDYSHNGVRITVTPSTIPTTGSGSR